MFLYSIFFFEKHTHFFAIMLTRIKRFQVSAFFFISVNRVKKHFSLKGRQTLSENRTNRRTLSWVLHKIFLWWTPAYILFVSVSSFPCLCIYRSIYRERILFNKTGNFFQISPFFYIDLPGIYVMLSFEGIKNQDKVKHLSAWAATGYSIIYFFHKIYP